MPSKNNSKRKLSAILFADIAGYTAMMQSDEGKAMHKLRHYQTVLKKEVAEHKGEIIKNYGDGSLCLFTSVLDAVHCSKALQETFRKDPVIPLRIGLHLGDVMYEENDIYGNAINVASRIESMGVPGAVLMSKDIQKKINNQSDLSCRSLGTFEFKNVEEPMEVFALANEGFVVPQKDQMKGKLKANTTSNRKWLIPALIGLVLAVLGSFYFFNQNNIAAPTTPDAIAIFPFDVKSGSPDIQYLGNGMVDLISTKLEGVPNLNPIDPNRVFNQLKKENIEVPALEKALEMSNTLGAAEFILGSIIEINDALQISASKYDAEGGLVAKETIDGNKTQLASLIDDLTRTLIADKLKEEGQELNSIAMMTSENLPALKAYLEGEQAFRKTDFRDAVDFFQTAVSEDSTFAMAWYRLHTARGWAGGTAGETFLEKAIQYSEKLAPKWQDLIKANKMWETGLPSNENMIAVMLRKYGENPEFTNLMAEHIFHFYPVHGRPFTEAKPWLEKSRALDPQNLESLRHLTDIAWAEGDEVALQQYAKELPPESRLWILNQIRLLTFQDTVTASQLEEVVAHPRFRFQFFWPVEAMPENPNLLPELGLRFAPYVDIRFIPLALAMLRGQEKERLDRYKANPPDNVRGWGSVASIIPNRNYLPYEELYQMALDSLQAYDEPRAFFASAKYAWALGQEELYQANKQKLTAASQQSQGVINPARYYHWSLAAFEARQNEDSEKALICIDSAFSYSPSSNYQRASEVAFDKIFMLADIYETQQEYEKGIQRLENIPMWRNYHESKGYATYRLTQLYEKNGDIDKALSKCNQFLRNYKDCDEKYRPWLEEVAERRQRLMRKLI